MDAAFSTGSINANKLSTGSITSTQLANDSVVYGVVAAAAVGTGELKTTTGEVSNSTAGTAGAVYTLPGGEYGFYPQVKVNISNRAIHAAIYGLGDPFTTTGLTVPTTYTTTIHLAVESDSPNIVYAQQRYVQSSPPYNVGGMDFGRFVYVRVNSSAEILGTWASDDPPWWTLAPRPQRLERQPDGTLKEFYTEHVAFDKDLLKTNKASIKTQLKKRKKERREIVRLKRQLANLVNKENFLNQQALENKGNDRVIEKVNENLLNVDSLKNEITSKLSEFEIQEIEITTEVKNQPMPLVPHPFITRDPGDMIFILSPMVSDYDLLNDLAQDGESVSELIHKNYIKIGDKILGDAPNDCEFRRFEFT